MKKRILVLVISLIVLQINAQDVVRIGFFNIPPHCYVEEGQSNPTGGIVDHWEEAIAPALGLEVEWVGPMSFPEVLQAMKDGSIDVMALATRNSERETFMDYPEFGLFETGAFVVLLNNNPLEGISSWSALQGYRIAIGDTYPYRDAMLAADIPLVEPDVTMINLTGFELLKNGEIDGIGVQQRISVFYDLKMSGNMFLARNIKILPVQSESTSFAYSTFNPTSRALFLQYNQYLRDNPDNRYQFYIEPYIH